MAVSDEQQVDKEMKGRITEEMLEKIEDEEIDMLFTACCLAREKAWIKGNDHVAWEYNALAGKLKNFQSGEGGK